MKHSKKARIFCFPLVVVTAMDMTCNADQQSLNQLDETILNDQIAGFLIKENENAIFIAHHNSKDAVRFVTTIPKKNILDLSYLTQEVKK